MPKKTSRRAEVVRKSNCDDSLKEFLEIPAKIVKCSNSLYDAKSYIQNDIRSENLSDLSDSKSSQMGKKSPEVITNNSTFSKPTTSQVHSAQEEVHEKRFDGLGNVNTENLSSYTESSKIGSDESLLKMHNLKTQVADNTNMLMQEYVYKLPSVISKGDEFNDGCTSTGMLSNIVAVQETQHCKPLTTLAEEKQLNPSNTVSNKNKSKLGKTSELSLFPMKVIVRNKGNSTQSSRVTEELQRSSTYQNCLHKNLECAGNKFKDSSHVTREKDFMSAQNHVSAETIKELSSRRVEPESVRFLNDVLSGSEPDVVSGGNEECVEDRDGDDHMRYLTSTDTLPCKSPVRKWIQPISPSTVLAEVEGNKCCLSKVLPVKNESLGIDSNAQLSDLNNVIMNSPQKEESKQLKPHLLTNERYNDSSSNILQDQSRVARNVIVKNEKSQSSKTAQELKESSSTNAKYVTGNIDVTFKGNENITETCGYNMGPMLDTKLMYGKKVLDCIVSNSEGRVFGDQKWVALEAMQKDYEHKFHWHRKMQLKTQEQAPEEEFSGKFSVCLDNDSFVSENKDKASEIKKDLIKYKEFQQEAMIHMYVDSVEKRWRSQAWKYSSSFPITVTSVYEGETEEEKKIDHDSGLEDKVYETSTGEHLNKCKILPYWVNEKLYTVITTAVIENTTGKDVCSSMEKVEQIISKLIFLVEQASLYNQGGVNPFIEKVAEHLDYSGLITTAWDYVSFCMDYLPELYIVKALRDSPNYSEFVENCLPTQSLPKLNYY